MLWKLVYNEEGNCLTHYISYSLIRTEWTHLLTYVENNYLFSHNILKSVCNGFIKHYNYWWYWITVFFNRCQNVLLPNAIIIIAFYYLPTFTVNHIYQTLNTRPFHLKGENFQQFVLQSQVLVSLSVQNKECRLQKQYGSSRWNVTVSIYEIQFICIMFPVPICIHLSWLIDSHVLLYRLVW